MTPMPILFAAFAGLLVGSFLNVVALRCRAASRFVSAALALPELRERR